MLTNLLTEVSLPLIELNGSISLGWLEKFIDILIGAVGITGLGIILYCLILKIVVLPLDVWQKSSMRKQNLKMESMRTQLEKLKAQYANNPEIYNKKIQEVYKANNYNMFSSCLPMIAMLVILIVAFQSLTTYSQYKNLQIYTDMSKSYNSAILQYYNDETAEEYSYTDTNGKSYVKKYNTEDEYFINYIYGGENDSGYTIDVEKMMKVFPDLTTDKECLSYLQNLGREAAAQSFKDGQNNKGFSFVLTKNIYYADVAWAHPLQDYKSFCNSVTKNIVKEDGTKVKIGEFIGQSEYEEITANLSEMESQPNGFFMLVVLTILANLASQFISMRSQKAQRELQSADPSSQSMQKIMMFVMPVIFCVFAFIYSGAFSLYLITSSVFSALSTLVVNKIIDERFKKKAEKQQATVVYSGRKNYTRDWEKNKQLNEIDKNKKNNKK
jgi:YidC/Oxa1 family membrane protein insertase